MAVVYLIVIATLTCAAVALLVVAAVCRDKGAKFAGSNPATTRAYHWRLRWTFPLGIFLVLATIAFTTKVAPTLQNFHR
jgi:hypothetical protein